MNLDPILQYAYIQHEGVDNDYSTAEDDEHSITTTNDGRAIRQLLQSHDFFLQRGLERYSGSRHGLLRRLKVVEVTSAVLLEQSTQILSGRYDPDLLCKVSKEASRSSQRFAQIVAQADAEIAMRVYESGLKQDTLR
jgi:hypothetical protein